MAKSGAAPHDDTAVLSAFDASLDEWDGQMRRAREEEATGEFEGKGGPGAGEGARVDVVLGFAIARAC